MYLVELRPGKEELYRSGEELAAAIRSGDVDVHSRIYHRATSKWISVTLHPHYKAIAAERDPSASTPLPAAEHRANWTFFNAASETLEGANGTKADSAPEDGGEDGHLWRRPIVLSVTGLLLIMGMQLAFFGPRPPWAGHKAATGRPQAPVLSASTAAQPSQSLVSLASTAWSGSEGGEWDAIGADGDPDMESPTPARVTRPALPVAPAIHLNSLAQALPGMAKAAPAAKEDVSALGKFLRYWTSAHDEAQSRMESGMRVARLNQLFSPARLTPNGGVTETRMAIAGAANFIRIYRQQREVIDREYQDSFVVMTRENKLSSSEIRSWYAKVTPKEMPALATLATTILTGMDSLLGVLDAQAGAYRIEKGTIHFEDPGAAQMYGKLRQDINKAVDVAKASGGADSTDPMGYLLEAIGATRLPKES